MKEITVMSFGFKYGLPQQADMVLDVRGLPNPFYVPALKEKTGLDREVQEYIFSFPESHEYLEALMQLLGLRLRLYENDMDHQPKRLTFAIGCTGGQHRSVTMALAVAERLQDMGYVVRVQHRQL